MRAGVSLGPGGTAVRASSNWPTAGRSSWTRSGICRWMSDHPAAGAPKPRSPPDRGLKALRIDVRVITATNRDLEQLVDSKVFREDLFYRINVFRINIPSLRERTGDVRQLAGFFLAKVQ